MSCGGGHGGGGGQKPTMVPARVHPRYVPRRGAVLKRIVGAALRSLLSPVNRAVLESAVIGRVRPAPPDMLGGDGAAEQGK